MKKLNNKGVTLVELVIATLLLAIASTSLLTCFTSVANILNRATYIKNCSAAAASSVELEQVYESKDENVEIALNGYNESSSSATLNIQAVKTITTVTEDDDASTTNVQTTTKNINFSVDGNYIIAKDNTEESKLSYKEFLPANFTFSSINN